MTTARPGILRTEVRISELAYDVLWEVYLRQEKHPALLCDSPGATWTERIELGEQVADELRQLRLARGGEPHPELLASLALLAEPRQEIYGWLSAPDRPKCSVLAASSSEAAVIAWLGDGYLTLAPCEPGALPAGIATGLPPRQGLPVRGSPLLVDNSAVDIARATDPPSRFTVAAHPTDPVEIMAREARRVLQAPRLGIGQFFAARREPAGSRRRCRWPLTYVDTPSGRFVITKQRSPHGAEQLRIETGGHAELTVTMQRLIANT